MSEHPESARDTDHPPPDHVRLGNLEARLGELEQLVRRQSRELRRQGYDRDLLMHSLRYLVQRHPHDEEDDARRQLLAHFDRWEEQREGEIARARTEDDEDDTRPSARFKL